MCRSQRFGAGCSLLLLGLLWVAGCGNPSPTAADFQWQPVSRMPLTYAEQFTVEYDANGYALLTIGDAGRYLLIPEDEPEPEGIPEDMVVLHPPLKNLYLAATSTLDFLVQLDALGQVGATSLAPENCTLPEVRKALQREEILYAGKYNAPDFEQLLTHSTTLAVENTMIYHCPEIKEKLEALGIPVLVDRSSYEPHPLGRMEWIRVYGLLTGRSEEAEAFFSSQMERLKELQPPELSGKTVAFFYISSAGAAVVRNPSDYVVKMIELAGGHYVFANLPAETTRSTITMQMESFYTAAKEADVLIYNGVLGGELHSRAELLEKSPLLADFNALKSGDVWCTEQDFFQKSSAAAALIQEMNALLTQPEQAESLAFFHRLQ